MLTTNDNTSNKWPKKKADNSMVFLAVLCTILVVIFLVLLNDKNKNKGDEIQPIEQTETDFAALSYNENDMVATARDILSTTSESTRCYINGDKAWNIEVNDGVLSYDATNELTQETITKYVNLDQITEMLYDINNDGVTESNEKINDTQFYEVLNSISIDKQGNITLKDVKLTEGGNVVTKENNVSLGTYSSHRIYERKNNTYYYFDSKGNVRTMTKDQLNSWYNDWTKSNGNKLVKNKPTTVNLQRIEQLEGDYNGVYKSK